MRNHPFFFPFFLPTAAHYCVFKVTDESEFLAIVSLFQADISILNRKLNHLMIPRLNLALGITLLLLAPALHA